MAAGLNPSNGAASAIEHLRLRPKVYAGSVYPARPIAGSPGAAPLGGENWSW